MIQVITSTLMMMYQIPLSQKVPQQDYTIVEQNARTMAIKHIET